MLHLNKIRLYDHYKKGCKMFVTLKVNNYRPETLPVMRNIETEKCRVGNRRGLKSQKLVDEVKQPRL